MCVYYYYQNCFRKTFPNQIKKSYLVTTFGPCFLSLLPFQALVEGTGKMIWQVSLAPQVAQLMQGTKVQAIDLAISIAVLTILIHIILDRVGRTVRIIHTVGKSCKVEEYTSLQMEIFWSTQSTYLPATTKSHWTTSVLPPPSRSPRWCERCHMLRSHKSAAHRIRSVSRRGTPGSLPWRVCAGLGAWRGRWKTKKSCLAYSTFDGSTLTHRAVPSNLILRITAKPVRIITISDTIYR